MGGISARDGSLIRERSPAIDTTEIIPIDLNALLFGLESAIRAGCERAGDHDCAEDYARRAAARRAAIDRYLWDQSRGAYLDYRWTLKQRIDRISAATLYPLFTRSRERGAGGFCRASGRGRIAEGRRDRRDDA